jgi:hypothetical protein
MVVLRKHSEVVSALKQGDAFTFGSIPPGFALTGAELQDPDGGLLRCDDPKFARAIRPIFSPRRVAKTRRTVEAIANELIAPIRSERGVVDFKAFSEAFVSRAVCSALGLPLNRWPFILRSSRVAFGVIGSTGEIPRVHRTWRDLYDFYGRVADQKRQRPDGAIVSRVVDVFDARGFSAAQAVRTIATISNGFPAALPVLDVSMVQLLQRGDVVKDCLRAPHLWPDVVGECMRHRAMFPVALPRRAVRDVMLADRRIAAGTIVLPSLLAAAHDPDHADDPDAFISRRDGARNNIMFGAGPHFCPGAAHTRLWLEAALRTFFERFPEAALADPASLEWQSGTLPTPKAIEVRVNPVARRQRLRTPPRPQLAVSDLDPRQPAVAAISD